MTVLLDLDALAEKVAERISASGSPQAFAQPAAIRYCGLSRSHWYRVKAVGEGPRSVLIGGVERWLKSDLDAWLRRQPARKKK